MFDNFCKHINSNAYFTSRESILLAVSGGIDSMLLCRLMLDAGYSFSVAHIDHTTRGEESKRDAAFVKAYCEKNNIPFFLKTITFNKNSGNFHDWAHKQRYQFFDSLGYDKIVTAHHSNDQIETILINVLNGRSVSSIPDTRGKYIRPLLPYSKAEIINEAARLEIEYRFDESNAQNKYLRNFLRNKVLSDLNEVLPHYENKLLALSQRTTKDLELLDKLILASCNIRDVDGILHIDIATLGNHDTTFLYHVLKRYGFNRAQAVSIFDSRLKVGGIFLSPQFKLLIDRNELLISEIRENSIAYKIEVFIDKLPQNVTLGKYSIQFSRSDELGEFSNNCAYFPLSLLGASLILRSWNHGDTMLPYGMNGQSKTVKKMFVDSKVDMYKKHKIPILLNNEDILWVMGLRTSHNYKCIIKNGAFLKVKFTENTT